MSLRRAMDKDLARVVEIYNSSVEWRLSTADTSIVSVDSKRNWFASRSKDRPLLVYERSGQIHGWASIDKYHERPAYKNTVSISIYIDHAHIGKRTGTTMLSEVVKLLPSLGVKTAIANIYSHNEASIKLFTNFGFELWGELPDVCEMDGKSYSVCMLGLKIDHR